MIPQNPRSEANLELIHREWADEVPGDAIERDRQHVQGEISRRRSAEFWAGVFAAVDAENDVEWEAWLQENE